MGTTALAGSSTSLGMHHQSGGVSSAAGHCDEYADTRAHKRARYLTEAEEDRLGKLVGVERWVETVGHGRGAAVCVCGEVAQTAPSVDPFSASTFILELSCFQPNEPGRRYMLTVMFQGELAHKVSEPLLLLHRLGPPAVVFLSGFAADLSPNQQGVPHATFQQEKVVIKMSPQPANNDLSAPASAIWIEQLATQSATTPAAAAIAKSAVVQPARTISAANLSSALSLAGRSEQPCGNPPTRPAIALANTVEPSPPSQSSDWFSTPAPAVNVAAPPNAAPASTSHLAPVPCPGIVKKEGHATSSSSASAASRPGRASSRQPSSGPAAPHRNAPHVKPRRMGNCLYTPMSMVRDGERASIIGIVMASGDPRRSSSGTRDLSIKITIADASCLSGTGYAKELARSMTIMLFAQQSERIPHNIAPGHIIAVRNIQIQMFSGKPQAVGKSAATWSWATYDPVSGDVRASSNFPLTSHTPPECSAEEMEHFRDMANWFSELQGVDANIVTRSSRPTLRLQDIGENLFFDTVVEVLKVYTHTLAPDLYVCDYTNHALFYRGNDKYLRLESDVPYPDDSDGWGHVFQISLWDSHATIAEGLQTGDIIRIQNVRPKLNPRGLLTGGLGSSSDNGIKIRTLKPTDEARIELERRRARFLETLFAAEEEAFANQVERNIRPASEQHPVQPPAVATEQQQQPPGGGEVAENARDRSTVSEDAVNSEMAGHAHPAVPAFDRGASTSTDSAAAATTSTLLPDGVTTQRAVRALDATPSSATQPPFPTPAQRRSRALKDVTPSKPALTPSSNENREANDFVLAETPDLKRSMLMDSPDTAVEERRPLIRCNAPASIPLTALAELQTTSLCPGMYKVKARVISTNPSKVEQWGRAECKACKRLLPLDQRFCIQCNDEDGESLSYCLRFAIMLEEVDAEYLTRKQQQTNNQHANASETSVQKTTIPLLFHGRSAEVLLPCVDAKAIFNGERSSIKTLRRFHNRLLHPQEYGKDPEQVLAVYSFPSKESGRTVRRFAALKELNCLQNPVDLL